MSPPTHAHLLPPPTVLPPSHASPPPPTPCLPSTCLPLHVCCFPLLPPGLLSTSLPLHLPSFSEPSYSTQLLAIAGFTEDVVRLRYSSWVTPDKTLDVDLATGREVIKMVGWGGVGWGQG